jgi:hypothetical protein
MDGMLRLHGDSESEFWTWHATTYQTQLLDMLGLTFSLGTSLLIASSTRPPHVYKQICFASGISILVQMLWSLLHRRSYMRCRVAAMAAQRLRWYCVALWMSTRSISPWDAVRGSIRGSFASEGPSTWAEFAAIAGYAPMVVLRQSFAFPLPYRHTLVSAGFLFANYLIIILHQQIHAAELLNLQRFTTATCMATPFVVLSITQQICSSKAGLVLSLMYLFALLGMLLPLQLVYWHEKAGKEMFLRLRGVRVPQRDGAVPIMLLLTVWAIVVVVLAVVSA